MKRIKKPGSKDTIKIDDKKLAIVGGVLMVGLMGFVTWLVIKNRKKKDGKTFSKSDTGKATLRASFGGGGFKCTRTSGYPLEYGTCSPEVAVLQRYLLKKGAALGSTGPGRNGVDGRFGKKTESALDKIMGKKSIGREEMKTIKNGLK